VALARSYQPAALLIGLVELDICSALATAGEAGLRVAELAGRLKLQARPLAALLEAATAFGLLVSREGHFLNSALAARYLVRGSPDYLGSQIASQADQYRGWADLPLAVREGRTVLPNLQSAEGAAADPALRRLLTGLHRGGQGLLPHLTPLLDPYLRTAGRLLDIGSGLGTFGVGWAEQYPQLETTLLDRPDVLELAREMVALSPAQDRVRFLPGDYHHLDFGRERYDLALFFQVLRTEGPEVVRQLLQKAALALKPGGHVVIYDTRLEDTRTGPLENVLQNLTMSLTYEEGGIFTAAELKNWLEGTGLKLAESRPVTAAARPMLLYLVARI
jgi:SAM-dependent methyltransferase